MYCLKKRTLQIVLRNNFIAQQKPNFLNLEYCL